MRLAIVLILVLNMQGCAYYSYSTGSSYGLVPVDTVEYLGPIERVGYDSEILSPVVTLDNGVQIKFFTSWIYNYPIKQSHSDDFKNLEVEVFITSLHEDVAINVSNITMEQYRFNRITKVKFMKLERRSSKVPDRYGVDVCTRGPDWESYNFYEGKAITIPRLTHDLNLLPLRKLREDKNIICGILYAPDTNLAVEQGFYNLYLTFIVDGKPKTYTIYFTR